MQSIQKALEWLLGFGPGELAKADDWQFRFVSPYIHSEYGNYIILLLMAVFGFMVFLTVRSYTREGDAPARAKASLGILRMLVVALTLLTLFQPALVLKHSRTLYSTLVVLVDDSASMAREDKFATDLDRKKAIADQLGVPMDQVNNMTRAEIVRRMLGKQDGAMEKLAKDHPIVLMKFSTTQPGKEDYTRRFHRVAVRDEDARPEGAEPLKPVSDELSGIMTAVQGRGYHTNLSQAIRDALKEIQGQRVAGLIVISEGQVTSEQGRKGLPGTIAYATQRKVPLYSVLVGDPTPPKSLKITGLQAPQEIRKGEPAEFTVSLDYRNLDGQSVSVKLQQRKAGSDEWQDTGVSEQVVLDGGGEIRSGSRGAKDVKLRIKEANELGEFYFRARVEAPTGVEVAFANPAKSSPKIAIHDKKIKVLLISGDAGFEFQYLRNFLLRQPDLYGVSVWQQNADKDVNQAASSGMKLDRLPRDLKQLMGVPGDPTTPGYDVIILYDPEPTQKGMDEHFAQMIEQFVGDHGGGLCYIASNKNSSDLIRTSTVGEPLSRLLPVVLAPNTRDLTMGLERRQPEPWPVQLTSYGMDYPITKLDADPKENVRVWDVLPGIYWSHQIFKVKPAARVLAVHSNPTYRTSKNEPEPLVVTQPYGAGRVMFMGFDGTWRWRFLRDGYYHRRYWANVIRYLATLKARRVIISTGGNSFAPGERVTVEVEAYDDSFKPLQAEKFTLQMIKNEEDGPAEVRELELDAVEDRPGRFRKTMVVKELGSFTLTAFADDPQQSQKVDPKTIEFVQPTAEDIRPEADPQIMRSVATDPRRGYVHIENLDKLAGPDGIPAGRLQTMTEDAKTLWDTQAMLLVILLLLVIEWALRKKYNMA